MAGAVCPGSFDPVTNGHLDIIVRAASQFDRLVVTVMINPKKKGLFSVTERMDMLREATADLPSVTVTSWQGLLVDFAREQGISAIVKGLRDATDFGYELQMAQMNHKLAAVDTYFLATNPAHGFLSSSLIKEIASYGGDVSDMVPATVHQRLLARLGHTPTHT